MPELLRIESISKKFGMYQVLSNISFSVRPEEILEIIGPNGAGKVYYLRPRPSKIPSNWEGRGF